MALVGILNVNKPSGCTSRDVVNRVERLFQTAKAGHAGTLDPLATGVLVICVGQATRLIPYVQRMRKHYRATFLLGHSSETDDTEGFVEPQPDAPQPSRTQLDCVLPRFVGSISQRPPVHSAVKLQGRRSYNLARQGIAVELAPRTVEIFRLEVARYEYPALEMDIECGSGTYVRALGRDIAQELGTAAVMSALERTAVGAFRVENAAALDELTGETLPQYLQPPSAAVADLSRVTIDDTQLAEIRHGRPIAIPAGARCDRATGESAEWAAFHSAGELVAILHEKRPHQLWPHRNFL